MITKHINETELSNAKKPANNDFCNLDLTNKLKNKELNTLCPRTNSENEFIKT